MDFNFEALKTKSGCLKLAHMVLGAIPFGIFLYFALHFQQSYEGHYRGMIIISGGVFFLFLVTSVFTATSFVLMISFLLEDRNERKRKSFEILYHLFGFMFYLGAGISLAIPFSDVENEVMEYAIYGLYVFAMICTFANSIAYAISSIDACRSRRTLKAHVVL